MNLNQSQRPRAEHGRKWCEGSKTKLSAHPVWDGTVDTMLEDAVAYDPARPLADDPVPVCSNIIKSKRGVRGRHSESGPPRGRQQGPRARFHGIYKVSRGRQEAGCGAAHSESGPPRGRQRRPRARFHGIYHVSRARQDATGGAAPVIYRTFASFLAWNAGIAHVLQGPGGTAPAIYKGFAWRLCFDSLKLPRCHVAPGNGEASPVI